MHTGPSFLAALHVIKVGYIRKRHKQKFIYWRRSPIDNLIKFNDKYFFIFIFYKRMKEVKVIWIPRNSIHFGENNIASFGFLNKALRESVWVKTRA